MSGEKARFVLLIVIAIFVGKAALAAEAADTDYPRRPIRMIIPAATSGTPDFLGRLIADELGKQLGQQVVVDNRPGAAGVLGFQTTARATPDGYTIGFASFPIATNPSMFVKLPYDAQKDFQMVVQTASGANLLAVSVVSKIESVQNLVELARKSPGKLMFGSSGYGTSMHLSMELLKQMTGTNLLHVPYKGIDQATIDAIGGRIQIVCDNMASMLPHVRIQDAKMRALAVTSSQRSSAALDVPTIAEAGIHGYELSTWSGFMVPIRVPREIVLRLNDEINRAIRSPVLDAKYFKQYGITKVGGSPEHFTAYVKSETEKWGRVLKAAGIRAE